MTRTIKAQTIEEYSETPTFILRNDLELDDELKEFEILVKVKAASFNAGDSHMSSGAVKLLFPIKFPCVLGLDGSGLVEKIGSKVTKFQVGDEVVGSLAGAKTGTMAEFCKFEEDDLILKPKAMSDLQAAGMPTAGGTVFEAFKQHPFLACLIEDCLKNPSKLVTENAQKKKFKLLIIGGAGGVGSLAVLFASTFLKRLLDLTIYVVASEKNIDYVKSLGADHVIDYTKTTAGINNQEYHSSIKSDLPSVCQVLRNEFNEDYVDMVVDCVGGYYYYDDVNQNLNCRKAEMQVIYASVAPPGKPSLDFSTILSTAYYMGSTALKWLSSKGYPKYSLVSFFGKKPKEFSYLMHNILTVDNRFSLLKLHVFEFENATEAMKMLKSKRTVGKIVVNIQQ